MKKHFLILSVSLALTGCQSFSPTNVFNNTINSITDRFSDKQTQYVGSIKWNKIGKKHFNFSSSVPRGYSRLVFIRLDKNQSIANGTNIAIDNRFHVSLKNARFSSVLTCAGVHDSSFSSTANKDNNFSQNIASLQALSQQTHFILISEDNDDISVQVIDEEQARDILSTKGIAQQAHQISRIKDTCQPTELGIDKTVVVDVDKPANKQNGSSKKDAELQEVANYLKANPDVVAVIEGDTDSNGNKITVPRKAKERAKEVIKELIEDYGVSPSSLSLSKEALGNTDTKTESSEETADNELFDEEIVLDNGVAEKPTAKTVDTVAVKKQITEKSITPVSSVEQKVTDGQTIDEKAITPAVEIKQQGQEVKKEIKDVVAVSNDAIDVNKSQSAEEVPAIGNDKEKSPEELENPPSLLDSFIGFFK